MTIATPNVATGVAGFILPGSRVDVHWAGTQSPGADLPLLENVEILAVDANIDAPAANKTDAVQMKSVTIQVSPDEARILTPALGNGTIYLSLRNPGDEGRAPPRLPEAKPPPQEVKRGLATMIKRGMRAVSIPTPDVASSVAGFLVPGNRVDLHWAPKTATAENRPPAPEIALLENVEILAVEKTLDAPTGNRIDAIEIKTVTVQVTPEEAGKLTTAIGKGTVHLSLRHPDDDGRGVALVPPPQRVIRGFHGVRKQMHVFEVPVKTTEVSQASQ